MDNTAFQKLKDFISRYQSIGVIVAPNPSLDQMAAGLGLFLVLKQMGKNASIVSPTDVNVSLSSLVGIDNVSKSFGNTGGDLTVSFPYNEGEIDKVSYNLENGKLNIVVKAGEKGISFNQKDVAFVRSGSLPELIICVGVPSLSLISNIYTPSPDKQVAVINIDNTTNNEKYGDMVVVDTRWSSVSEQISDFVTLLEPQIELDADTSQNLLDGIISATNNFTGANTSYLAFEVAGILMKKGATRGKALSVVNSSRGVGTNMPLDNNFFPNPTKINRPQPVVTSPVQPRPVNPTFNPNVVPVNNNQNINSAPVNPNPVPVQPQPQNINQMNNDNSLPEAPPDWLTPKVYKGSTVI